MSLLQIFICKIQCKISTCTEVKLFLASYWRNLSVKSKFSAKNNRQNSLSLSFCPPPLFKAFCCLTFRNKQAKHQKRSEHCIKSWFRFQGQICLPKWKVVCMLSHAPHDGDVMIDIGSSHKASYCSRQPIGVGEAAQWIGRVTTRVHWIPHAHARNNKTRHGWTTWPGVRLNDSKKQYRFWTWCHANLFWNTPIYSQ